MHSTFAQVTYHFFHWKKGTPFSEDQGIYNGLTWWEQIENGQQLTRNRKFFTVVPVLLYLIASHTTDYQNPMLFLNTLAVFVLVVAKFPRKAIASCRRFAHYTVVRFSFVYFGLANISLTYAVCTLVYMSRVKLEGTASQLGKLELQLEAG
uniref:ORMDL family protein n=1 Tax=Chenopodium quinoa TaxID=63459 RepID=A0A803LWP3_CHEQI